MMSKRIISIILITIVSLFANNTVASGGTTKKASSPFDIAFFIIDMKVNNQELKILEFGEGNKSYFKGHEQIYGGGIIWEQLWDYLKQFNMPIWYVGTEVTKPHKKREIAYEKFEKIGGMFAKDFTQLKQNEVFKKITKPPVEKNKYTGIIIKRHLRLPTSITKNFKKKFPQILVINDASSPFVNNKKSTTSLFDTKELKKLRPRWGLYSKCYTPELKKQIIRDFPQTDIFVIKPLNAANGQGVIIVEKKDLSKTLKKILKNKKKLRRMTNSSYNQWGRDTNKTFLIEEYVPSVKIKLYKKTYDPTMRMVVAMSYDLERQETSLAFLGGYWKFPAAALEDPGTLTKKHKSKIVPLRKSSVAINKDDKKRVEGILSETLPILYLKMVAQKLER